MIDLIEIKNGSAVQFRSDINEDFDRLNNEADRINTELINLDGSLADVAKSGLSSDLIQDPEHQLANATEKARWNKKTWIDTSVSPAVIYQDDDDITDEFVEIFEDVEIPTKISELENDAQFLSASSYNINDIVYQQNAIISEYDSSHALTTEFPIRGKVLLSGCTEQMIPTVIFSQEDSLEGNFAQVAQSSENCVYIWMKTAIDGITIPLVYAIPADRLG